MTSGIKGMIKSTLFACDLYAAKQTHTEDILRLIQKLRPLDCGKELIRIGGGADGGYLVPDDLDGIEYCFSPGVNTISDFENELADRGITSFLADYSVSSPPITRKELVFDAKFVGASDRDEYLTLQSWKDKYIKGYSDDLLLQMDIEGSEYEVILGAQDSLLNQFRIAVIEFHYLDRLFEPFGFKIISSCFEKILQSFHVVHIHPNNRLDLVRRGGVEIPATMEFTFLNKRRARAIKPITSFPHPLDKANVAGKDMALPKCWFS